MSRLIDERKSWAFSFRELQKHPPTRGIQKDVLVYKGVLFNELELTRQQAASHFTRLTVGIKPDQFQELRVIMKLPIEMLVDLTSAKASHLLACLKSVQEDGTISEVPIKGIHIWHQVMLRIRPWDLLQNL